MTINTLFVSSVLTFIFIPMNKSISFDSAYCLLFSFMLLFALISCLIYSISFSYFTLSCIFNTRKNPNPEKKKNKITSYS